MIKGLINGKSGQILSHGNYGLNLTKLCISQEKVLKEV